MLEQLILDADERIIATLDDRDKEQWNGYFDVTQ